MAGESGIIEMKITSDSSEVRSDMEGLAASVNKSTGKLIHDIDGVTTSHNNLLRSDHRVAAALRGLTSNAIASGDALSGAGTAMEALAMATNVSLPALIGLEVVGSLISKIAKAHEEAVKLNKELDEAGKPRDPQSTLPIAEDIKDRAEKEKKARADAKEKRENPWLPGTNWIWKAWDWSSKRAQEAGAGMDIHGPSQKEAYQRAHGKLDEPDEAEHRKRQADAIKVQIDALKKQTEEEKELEHLAKVVAKGKIEKLQFSLEELAKKGREFAPGDDSRPGAGKLAKRALKEEALAKKEMLAEHYDLAFEHQLKADRIKSDIVPLRNTEKDIVNAINMAQIFKDQLKALQDMRRELYVFDTTL
jgi:hypothetical protein